MTVYTGLMILHLGAMGVWMGAGLLAPADARRTLTQEPPLTLELLKRLRRTAQLMNGAAYITVLSGLTLIVAGRGFATTPASIWWGLGLTMLAIALGRLWIRPVIGAMAASVDSPLTRPEAERLAARFALGVHAESAVRVIVLVLMVN